MFRHEKRDECSWIARQSRRTVWRQFLEDVKMVSFTKCEYMQNDNGKYISYVEGKCLSTDTKPTDGIANGSVLLEMDTSKVYMFDGAGKSWKEWG